MRKILVSFVWCALAVLAKGCYLRMFAECSKLERAPDLLAVEPQPGCYFAMVRNCTKLKYVKCRLWLTASQRTTTRPDNSYNDTASPPTSNVETWTIINMWTVFNKWLGGTQNSSDCYFYKHPYMVYPRGAPNTYVGAIQPNWNVIDAAQ